MHSLSKWTMLLAALLFVSTPFVVLTKPGATKAEPIETGEPFRVYVPTTYSLPVEPIQPEPTVVSPVKEPEALPAPSTAPVKEPEPQEPEKPEGRSEKYKATAYTIAKGQVPNLKGITATGTKVKKGRTIAVDPRKIPLGSLVYIESDFPGITGYYTAEDTGSAIKGSKIDVFFGWGGKGTDAYEDAMEFGRRTIEVTIVRKGYDKEDAV